ncbi:DUF4214 domain-containing protein [Asticcacaulis sp. W401b]|uniref:DUF4214 domain-containing protein n=1 Tax=Asticcacaulis sp. W401b TaxID=3388666 RepID=UPI003970F922
MTNFFSKLKYARDVLCVHEMVKTSARVLGGEDSVSPGLIDRTIAVYSDPKQFEVFLRALMQSENFAEVAATSYGVARHFVSFVYKLVLRRDPEEEALHAFASAISEGKLTFDSFSIEIMSSPEAKMKGGAGQKDFYAEFLNRVNEDLCEGSVTASEIDYLSTELAMGRSNIAEVYRSLVKFERLTIAPEDLPKLISVIYQACFDRRPGDEEISIWKGHISSRTVSVVDFCKLIFESDETKNYRNRLNQIATHLSDAQFTQMVYESQLERGAGGAEIASWAQQLSTGQTNRLQMLSALFNEYVLDNTVRPLPENNPYEVHLMGTTKKVNAADWKRDLQALKTSKGRESLSKSDKISVRKESRFAFNVKKKQTLVTAIASLYKGGDYIEHFLKNITEQSIFRDYAELIIVDANSPENESVIIEKFVKSFPNIRYKRYDYRVSIYDAWNIGVNAAEGQFLTNTNMDDVRRQDALECQAASLIALPFVDVVYQDFYYAFDKNVAYDHIAELGAKSQVGLVTPHGMFSSNPPHNAPMWRKSLHGELGLFDGTYKSAGDYEFWMRCLAAGKVFYKLNDPHATYFQNPTGLSTSKETPGLIESKRITKKYGRKLIPEAFTCSSEDFLRRVGAEKETTQLALKPSDRYDYIQHLLEKAASDLKYKIALDRGK